MIPFNFKQFLEQNTVGKHNDGPGMVFTTSDWSELGTQRHPDGQTVSPMDVKLAPANALTGLLPQVTKTSKIRLIERNKNPILIMLEDGTKLYLSWDEFKSIRGPEPQLGKTLTVVFQRSLDDRSKELSQINSILCH